MTCPRFIAFGMAMLAGALAGAPASAAPYLLGTQDKLRISVFDWPNVSGQYVVGLDGTISLPLLGDIRGGGLATAELAHQISAQIQQKEHLPAPPVTAVDILEYRPFFVAGDVQRPGQYPYTPRLTVLQAVSIAGGTMRLRDPALLSAARDVSVAQGDIRVAALQIRALQARQLRLEAEAADRKSIAPPDERQRGTDPQSADLLAQEQALLTTRRQNLDLKIASLTEVSDLYAKEILSIEAQMVTEHTELATLQKQVETMHGLLQKGYAATPQSLGYEASAADVEAKIQDLETATIRAKQNISQTNESIRTARDDMRAAALTDLQSVKQQIKEIRERQNANAVIVRQAGSYSKSLVGGGADENVAYTIVSDTGSGPQERVGSESDTLQPGDVLKVTDQQSLQRTDW